MSENLQDLLAAIQAASRTEDFARAADLAEEAVAAYPDSLEAHQARIMYVPRRSLVIENGRPVGDTEALKDEMAAANAAMMSGYEERMRAEPSDPRWPYLLAMLAVHRTADQERYLEAAIEADPSFAKAYKFLANLRQMAGDNEGYLALLRQARDLAPDDAEAAFSCAYAVRGGERLGAMLDFADRFPDHENVVFALTEAAQQPGAGDDVWERLERTVTVDQAGNPHTMGGLYALIKRYVARDLQRAIAIAEPMPPVAAALRALATARDAMRCGYPAAALSALDEAPPLDRYTGLALDPDAFVALRFDALRGLGRADEAREVLAQRLAFNPAAGLWVKANGNRAIRERVWELRDEASTESIDFDLPGVDGSRVRLSDRLGKVVLLNFWYPGCGPCRNEFRHLAPVVEALSGRDFEVICINGVVEEDDLVAGFMAGNGYPFTATVEGKSVTEAYGVNAFPTALLIDHTGRIVFRPRIQDAATAEGFRVMVEELLAGASETVGA